jgi:molybdopterin-guanine dinucleotide biosynthesis protein MobB
MPRPSLLAITGRKHAGKTTLLVRLAAELHRRGHRVMTIKHGSHTFNIDPSTTDTYRHYHEGNAERVAMVAPDKFALIERWSDELSAEEVAERYMSDADVVLCEGFKRSGLPKIEIHRGAEHGSPLYGSGVIDDSTCVALVTDVAGFGAPVPVFDLGDSRWLDALATFVERSFVSKRDAAGD